MRKLLLLAAFVLTIFAANAQTAAEVNADNKRMMSASTPCNQGSEPFKDFIAKFSTDAEFMNSRIDLPADVRSKYADLLVPENFTAKTPYEKDGEEYYQSWGELQFAKAYLCCGIVDSYDTHTFVFKRQNGGPWKLAEIVPGE